jgi:hypothetical protein
VTVAVALLALLALLGACGSGGDDGGGDNAAPLPGDFPSATTEAPPSTAPAAGNEGVPDACTAFDRADVRAAFGPEPGAGTPVGSGARRICTYEGGTVVGVSERNQLEPSISLATANGATCTPVAGVGETASFCNSFNQIGQLLWATGPLMYDLTAATTDQMAFTTLAAKLKL